MSGAVDVRRLEAAPLRRGLATLLGNYGLDLVWHEADAEIPGSYWGECEAGLVGTRYTMEQSFYSDRLASHGIDCVTPQPAQRDEIHRIIFEELCKGVIRDDSRTVLRSIAADLARQGADCLLLACTELCMLIGPNDVGLPVLDTTHLHATAAVDHALAAAPLC